MYACGYVRCLSAQVYRKDFILNMQELMKTGGEFEERRQGKPQALFVARRFFEARSDASVVVMLKTASISLW